MSALERRIGLILLALACGVSGAAPAALQSVSGGVR